MRRLPYGGLLLLVIGGLALAGYLTGNLERWLAALFTPQPTPLVPPASARPSAGGAGTVRAA
jgi:hypothetical protein